MEGINYNSGAFNAGNVGEQLVIEETKMFLVWGIMELLTWQWFNTSEVVGGTGYASF